MSIKSIKEEWPNIPLTDEEAQMLNRICRNPIYKDVVSRYCNRNDAEGPLGFSDIRYWLEYEANLDESNGENDRDWMYSKRSIKTINKWLSE